jgi:hypothetical protein
MKTYIPLSYVLSSLPTRKGPNRLVSQEPHALRRPSALRGLKIWLISYSDVIFPEHLGKPDSKPGESISPLDMISVSRRSAAMLAFLLDGNVSSRRNILAADKEQGAARFRRHNVVASVDWMKAHGIFDVA